jgi:phosphoenolpyruvate synthase/pyruvate phosphate dikinase
MTPSSKKLQKIVTRFYYPITIQVWFNGATRGLRKVIGKGFSDVIVKFDRKKLEVFRIAKELHSDIKDAMLRYVTTKKFYNGIKDYKKLILEYDNLLRKGKDIREIVKHFEKLYPLFAIGFFVSNLFIKEIKNNRKKIVELCEEYRKLSEGILNKLDQYVADYLRKKRLPLFTTLEMLRDLKNIETIKKETKLMQRGYIFSKGRFYTTNISWQDFLQKNNFIYQEELISVSKKEIKGSVAFPGKVKGRVKIVFSPFDFKKIRKGDVLVSPMTQPTFMTILPKLLLLLPTKVVSLATPPLFPGN